MLGRAAAFALAVSLIVVGPGTAHPTPAAAIATAAPHVTVFGDSVAEAVVDYTPAHTLIEKGYDVLWEVAPCRRVDQQSCTVNGVRPPNVIDVINELGTKLGPNVVVAVGYNDYADQYPNNVLEAVSLMERAGVKRIFWLTLHVGHADYAGMNDSILRAAAYHKSMIPVDWNVYSQAHPEWFQGDGVHLNEAGAAAMATLIHNSLDKVLHAPRAKPRRALALVTARLPDGRRGKQYGVKLSAVGGRQPYFWTLPRALPRGLRLRSTGWIGGIPKASGTFAVVVRVRDAAGKQVTRHLALRIRG